MLRNNIDNSQPCLPIKFNADIQVAYLSRLKFNLKNKVRENARILHCDTNAPSHVFLVGSGNRMKQNFIPAFKCLDYPVVISGIYSRTSQHATEVGELWGIESQAELECPALANADVIVISITTRYVSDILKKIHRFTDTKNKVLIIDTPVFEGLKHIQSAYLLRKYQNTIVTEDYMNFPQFAIVRDIIKQGKLGNIKKIEMHNIGYRYHGLATARAFLEFSLVRSACYQDKALHYQVNNDCEIVVVQMHRRRGGMLQVPFAVRQLHDMCKESRRVGKLNMVRRDTTRRSSRLVDIVCLGKAGATCNEIVQRDQLVDRLVERLGHQ